VLYCTLANADLSSDECEIWRSEDKALSWTDSGWNFTMLGTCALLNYGRDYEGAKDDYVYLYSSNTRNNYNETDEVVLLRAPRDRVMEESAWEFFAGMDGAGPTWSSNASARAPVFVFPDGCNRLDVSYNAALRRYFMTMRARAKTATDHPNHFSIYDAPKPWGPWTTVFYTESRLPGSDMSEMNQSRGGWGENEHIPTKWISEDGKEFWLVYSGDDKFTLRRGVFRVRLVTRLRFTGPEGLEWDAVDGPATYDLVRSGDPTDLAGGDATCVATGISGTAALDADLPDPGTVAHYLVRAMDGGEAGPVGPDWYGNERPVRLCP
jgi:hypothetical protein